MSLFSDCRIAYMDKDNSAIVCGRLGTWLRLGSSKPKNSTSWSRVTQGLNNFHYHLEGYVNWPTPQVYKEHSIPDHTIGDYFSPCSTRGEAQLNKAVADCFRIQTNCMSTMQGQILFYLAHLLGIRTTRPCSCPSKKKSQHPNI